MNETQQDSTENIAAYRQWDPDEKISSPGSSRHTFKVRNQSDKSGKYSLKIGNGSTEQYTIARHKTQEHDVGGNAVVGVNKGEVVLEWQRS